MNPRPGDLAIVLLAAGSSSRMGQPKQQLPVDGKPLLVKAAEAAIGAGTQRIIVVLGSGEQAHRQLIQHLPVDIIFNPDWAKGMGTSLRMGLRAAVKQAPGLNAVMIVVCDQPLLTSRHLKALIQKYNVSGSRIVGSAYANTVGVPALFDHSQFQRLLALEDGQGAKKILLEESASLESVEFPEGAIDLDTPDDYQSFLKNR